MLGSKSGRGHTQRPAYENGNYYIDSSKWGRRQVDTAPYTFQGANGKYDIMPYLQKMHESPANAAMRQFGGGRPAYSSMNAYNDIIKAMGNDVQAVNAFKSKYAPTDVRGMYGQRMGQSVDFGLNKKNPYASTPDAALVANFSKAGNWNNKFFTPNKMATALTNFKPPSYTAPIPQYQIPRG